MVSIKSIETSMQLARTPKKGCRYHYRNIMSVSVKLTMIPPQRFSLIAKWARNKVTFVTMVPMKKIRWYIKIHDEEEEGPYTFEELKKDYRVHPLTSVRREGEEEWVAAIEDPLLEKIFEEERPSPFPKTEEIKKSIPDGEVIAIRSEPPYYFLLVLLIIILLFYCFYKFYSFYD